MESGESARTAGMKLADAPFFAFEISPPMLPVVSIRSRKSSFGGSAVSWNACVVVADSPGHSATAGAAWAVARATSAAREAATSARGKVTRARLGQVRFVRHPHRDALHGVVRVALQVPGHVERL